MVPTAQAVFSRNRLLSAMTPVDFDRLRPHLERVPLAQRQVLEEPGVPVPYVYFLEPGVASVVATTRSGERLEVGVVGPEGMTGLSVVHGSDRSPFLTFVQVAGSSIRLAADPLRAALEESSAFRGLLLRYAQVFAVQVAYTALANGRQTVEERLARWLLMCHDRIDGDAIPLTHEFLSVMLGVRRAGVTTSLHVLEGAKMIRSTRARIEILDRDELEQRAGECYGPPEVEYERLMP